MVVVVLAGSRVHGGAVAAGVVTAAAVSAVVLPAVLIAGGVSAIVAFVWLLLVSSAPPEVLIGLRHGGVVAVAGGALLEIGPSVWRYRGVAGGDLGALVHGVAWIVAGIAVAAWRVARLGGRSL